MWTALEYLWLGGGLGRNFIFCFIHGCITLRFSSPPKWWGQSSFSIKWTVLASLLPLVWNVYSNHRSFYFLSLSCHSLPLLPFLPYDDLVKSICETNDTLHIARLLSFCLLQHNSKRHNYSSSLKIFTSWQVQFYTCNSFPVRLHREGDST